ncbi:MAG: hypothetical protein K2J66_04740 [Muribaculaceae bacterium]|nr:hypothetical protein [Muribaculaceae bacterium]
MIYPQRANYILLSAFLLSASSECVADTADDCDADGITLLDEPFDRSLSGSMDHISYSGDIDSCTGISGWYTSAIGLCEGHFVFAPAIDPVTLVTPPLSVSVASPLRVTMAMAEYNNERYYTGASVEVTLLHDNGDTVSVRPVEITQAGFAEYEVSLDIAQPPCDVRIMLSYDNGGSNRKLFLDRLTVTQSSEASTEAITSDSARAWISGQHEITVDGRCARVFAIDGRCLYEGSSAVVRVNAPVIIAVVDGIAVKLRL